MARRLSQVATPLNQSVLQLDEPKPVLPSKTDGLDFQLLQMKTMTACLPNNPYKARSLILESIQNVFQHPSQDHRDLLIEFGSDSLLIGLQYGFQLGLTNYQLCRWLTLLLRSLVIMTESITSHSGSWSKIFAEYLKTPLPNHERLEVCFTKHQLEELMEFVILGSEQHWKLLKYSLTHPQEFMMNKNQKKFQEPEWQLQPLQQAIPKEKWGDYVRQEEEKQMQEKIAQQEQQAIQELKKEIERRQLQSQETLQRLQQLQNEAEATLRMPLPPYPEQLAKPTYEAIFRKRDPAPPVQPPTTQKTNAGKQPQKEQKDQKLQPPKAPPKRVSEIGNPKRDPTTSMTAVPLFEADETVEPRKIRSLPPPPNYKQSADLKSWITDFKLKPPSPPKVEQPKVPEKPKKEFVPLPADLPLERQELTTLVQEHMNVFLQDWVSQLQARLDWETQQWQERIEAIQKIKQEKELELLRCKQDQDALLAKISEISQPKKQEMQIPKSGKEKKK